LSYKHLTVSAGLNRFKPHVWQKQVFAGRNPTLGNEIVAMATKSGTKSAITHHHHHLL